MIYVFLAEGFEEVEALTPVDVLRRAGCAVQTVGICGRVVRGSHGIAVQADITDDEARLDDIEMAVLPGGMPGAQNLERSPVVQRALEQCLAHGKYLAAICAAPFILGHKGVLSGKKATCYPGFEKELKGARVTGAQTEVDGSIITGRGPGAAMAFALTLVKILVNQEKAEELAAAMCLLK